MEKTLLEQLQDYKVKQMMAPLLEKWDTDIINGLRRCVRYYCNRGYYNNTDKWIIPDCDKCVDYRLIK